MYYYVVLTSRGEGTNKQANKPVTFQNSPEKLTIYQNLHPRRE